MSADNVALPTFAAAQCCGMAAAKHQPCSNQSIFSARRVHSSKCAAVAATDRQRDRWTDARQFHRPCSRQDAGHASNSNTQLLLLKSVEFDNTQQTNAQVML